MVKKMKKSKVFKELDRLCRDEIILMDGPLGTMVQKHKLQEEDYRGDLLKNHSLDSVSYTHLTLPTSR